jgi:hypothetical protein
VRDQAVEDDDTFALRTEATIFSALPGTEQEETQLRLL